jgi:Trk K+ transport system NAD-binding subunit
LPTADAPHQTIGKAIGLAVFASDALSSTAYATQEILVILALAGTLAFGYAFPISLAIVVLLAIVTISYIKDLVLPEQCVIAAIIRQGEIMLPRGITILEVDDEVLAVTDREGAEQLALLFAPPTVNS